MSTSNYSVIFSDFTNRHYIKSFIKKYPTSWKATRESIENVLMRAPALIGDGNMIEIICTSGDINICKMEFRVAQTTFSAKASGNRCIVAINHKSKQVEVLIVYGKGNVELKNETVWWKNVVSSNFKEYRDIIK